MKRFHLVYNTSKSIERDYILLIPNIFLYNIVNMCVKIFYSLRPVYSDTTQGVDHIASTLHIAAQPENQI